MKAYYNEFDKNAAAWLKELCGMNLIANGKVDERSIVDVSADDIRGFDQCHFFAGIAGWPYSLRLAGIPDDYPVWTASLPCQPFSTAGKQLGKADERHLLPHFLELVNACKPALIFGEQVPGAIRHGWLDDLCDEMEREGYTVRASVLTAAGIGAPHIRQRLYWVAYSESQRERGMRGFCHSETREKTRAGGHQNRESVKFIAGSAVGWMGISDSNGCESWSQAAKRARHGNSVDTAGWHDCDWLYCRDDKHRPIKSGIKPLVDGVSRGMVYSSDSGIAPNETGESRAMRLKGYGNAIVPQVAAGFIKSFMESHS